MMFKLTCNCCFFQIYRISNEKLTSAFTAARRRVVAEMQAHRVKPAVQPCHVLYHASTMSRIVPICTNGFREEIESEFHVFVLVEIFF